MTTIDKFLLKLNTIGINQLSQSITDRDKRVLVSLSKQIISGSFLTENQGNLLLKILKENQTYLDFEEIKLLDAPTWSQKFRRIDQKRTVVIKDNYIVIEFTYNKNIRKLVTEFSKIIDGTMMASGTLSMLGYTIPMSENNIRLIVPILKKNGFTISDELLEYYNTIAKIVKENANPFKFESLDNPALLKLLSEEIDTDDLLLRTDRRLRYQYHLDDTCPADTLAEKIANRKSTKIYVNSSLFTWDDIIPSLQELKRFPLLIIFNSHDAASSLHALNDLKKVFDKHNITDVGVYFRFLNMISEEFNQKVKEYNYNAPLTSKTQVAIISQNNLPKFLFKEQWYPKAVISLSTTLKTGKVSVFCDEVDLKIFYAPSLLLTNSIDEIL